MYLFISEADIQATLQISHVGITDFFNPSNSWIEVVTNPETIFACDKNRRLHFDEGFLCACYRILKDTSISSIGGADHFPYRDLLKFRKKTEQLTELYRQGSDLLAPLFFYPAAHQLEILDGVHRCLAAFELVDRGRGNTDLALMAELRIWVGFNHSSFNPEFISQQLCVERVLPSSSDSLNSTPQVFNDHRRNEEMHPSFPTSDMSEVF